MGRPVLSLHDFQTKASGGDGKPGITGRTPRNLTRTLCDTALSRFAKTETRVQFLTNGGTPAEQARGEECTDAANALVEQTKSEQELRKAALHAVVFDVGYVKVIEEDDGPVTEHVPAWEIMFDHADAHRGRPSIMVQRFPADRDALVAKFAPEPDVDELMKMAPDERKRAADKHRELVDDILASGSQGMITPDHTPTEQHCLVYELWRLPVGRAPGRHVVVTDNALLLDEPWADKSFSGTLFGWSEPLTGIYPESIAAIVSGVQDELDGVGVRISQILRLCAVPQYVEEGPGEIATAQIRGGTDAIGDVVKVGPGAKLTRQPAGPVVGPELFNHEDRVWQRGFAMTGINEQSSMGTRPSGLNSAPAQREWNEINQDRLALVALEYQQAHVELATKLLAAVARIPEYEIKIKSPNGKWLKKVRAEALNLAESDYTLVRYPIGALPTTPTGKLATASDLLQAGAIEVDEWRDICNFPDLKAKVSIRRASERATEKLVGKMLATGNYEAPPEMIDAVYAIKYAGAQYLNGIADDLPDDHLQLLSDWIGALKKMLQPPPAPAAAAGALPPGGGPGAPPPASLTGTSIAPITPAPLAPPPPAEMSQAA